ncbi:dihydrodipicolinate synthase family protein [Chitinophaga lutea]
MQLSQEIKHQLMEGAVIPAHPLALHDDQTLDVHGQQLLTQYYLSAGAGGIAVGVHTTQFAIRRPEIGLLRPVLTLAAEEVDRSQSAGRIIKVAGICGNTQQACAEAKLAAGIGYHLGLVSLGGLTHMSEADLLRHVRDIALIIPVFGFYLQPSVGGRVLSYAFWRAFADIPNVHAIKIAAFNRYQTLDVVRAVAGSARGQEIALYTGNDDNIVADLITPFQFRVNGKKTTRYFSGGLLGHWAVWTHAAVKLFKEIKIHLKDGLQDVSALLQKGVAVTDMNAALFDPAHDFRGCIPGIHQVLFEQGIIKSTRCLNPNERLSPGQLAEIYRVRAAYPDLTDDAFTAVFLTGRRMLGT